MKVWTRPAEQYLLPCGITVALLLDFVASSEKADMFQLYSSLPEGGEEGLILLINIVWTQNKVT